jgi:hypothetical protein
MNTPVVASSTLNIISPFGVQTLPGCGHVVNVQRPLGAERPENEGR